MTKNIICGVGINDAGYVVKSVIDGKTVECKFYATWRGMIRRCYGSDRLKKFPSYADCSVCDEWLTFSNFKSWMEAQDWGGKQLDKDIIVAGNKIYSPETCAFVDAATNTFIGASKSSRGAHSLGVSFKKDKGKFAAYCGSTNKNKARFIGYFDDPADAHAAWRRKKHELACQLAELQSDNRVASALKTRYL